MAELGISEWFAREVLPHEVSLKRVLGRRGLQQADVEDLCQDVYVRLLESHSAEDVRPRSAKALALTAARNLAIDLHRSAHRYREHVGLDSEELRCELTPERHAVALSDVEALQVAFCALPVRRRQIFWERRVERRSVQEIARSLGIRKSTVERHLTLALRALRDAGFTQAGTASR
jgi:RNA polymerase sigma factor (sigma-70 family)